MKTSRVPIIISIACLFAFLIPIYYLFFGAYKFGNGAIDWGVILQEKGPLIDSFETALGGAIIGTTLGAIYAWIVVRTDVPAKRLLGYVPLLGITMPPVIKAIAWTFLLNPNNGILNSLFINIFHLSAAPFTIYGLWGIIFVSGVSGMPLAYFILSPALASIDPSLEETSKVIGNSSIKTAWRVTFPLVLPALVSVFVLALIGGFGALDTPLILGTPVRFYTLATEIDFWALGSNPPRFGFAASIGIIFIVVTLVLVALYIALTRKSFRYAVIGGKGLSKNVNKLRKWRYPALFVCLAIFTFTLLLPLGVLIFASFTKYFEFINGQVLASYWMGNWKAALSYPALLQSFLTTIEFAIAACIGSTILALFLSYAFLKSRVRGSRSLEVVSYLPLVIPGIVYSLAIFWTFLLLPGVSKVLYGTIWPMVITTIFISLPFSVRVISSNMVQISGDLEETGRVSGMGWWRSFWMVTIPLLGRSLITSFSFVFVTSMIELGAVLLLATSGTTVLTVLILQLWDAGVSFGEVAALSVLITLFIGAVLIGSELIRRSTTYILERRRRSSIRLESAPQIATATFQTLPSDQASP